MLKRFVQFIKGRFHKSEFTPGTVSDSAEMEFEKERRRGVRGD